MTGRGGPEVRVEQCMHEGAVAAGALAEDTAATAAATVKFSFDVRHGLLEEKIRPGTHGGAVDVLVAAQSGEAVRKRDDRGRHGAGADQPVEALGHLFAEILPVRVRRTGPGRAHEVDGQWH